MKRTVAVTYWDTSMMIEVSLWFRSRFPGQRTKPLAQLLSNI